MLRKPDIGVDLILVFGQEMTFQDANAMKSHIDTFTVLVLGVTVASLTGKLRFGTERNRVNYYLRKEPDPLQLILLLLPLIIACIVMSKSLTK